jgi:hypothetical protein
MDRLQTSCGNPSIMGFMLLAISSFVKSSSLASKAHNAGRTVLWYEQCLLHSSSLVYAPRSHLHWAHVAHPEQLRVTRSRANAQRSRHEAQRQKHHFRGISESCPEDKRWYAYSHNGGSKLGSGGRRSFNIGYVGGFPVFN